MISCLLYVSSSIFVIYIIADILWRIRKQKLAFLPHSPNLPWIGSLPFVGNDSHAFFNTVTKYYTDYDHLYVMWFGPKPAVRIGCVEYLEVLLRSQSIIKKSSLYDQLCEWLGKGLLISDGKKWKKRRQDLTPAFHFSILKNFIDDFELHSNHLVNKIRAFSEENESVEVQEMTSLATLDVMCETSMGVKINALESYGSVQYVQAVDQTKTLFLSRILNPLLWKRSVYQYTPAGRRFYENLRVLHNFTTDVINKNIVLRNSAANGRMKRADEEVSDVYQMKKGNMRGTNDKKKRVFLDILIDLYEKGEIDLLSIREEVDTFMFEGHDTTSSALSWTIYEIGRHPEVQEKLFVEADIASSLQCPFSDKIRSLKYLENVIKESMRLHPPVPLFGRILEEELVIGKDVIPVGTEMIVESFSVHMNEKYWKNPSLFNPNRFESDDFLKRNPYCYIPFSAGPRNCIGQKFAMLELKIMMFAIIRNFRWESLQTLDEVQTCVDVITHAGNGLHIKFSSR